LNTVGFQLRLEDENNDSLAKPAPVFIFFAAAILFSVVREWSAPIACARILIDRTHPFRRGE
jgi:hypothetical protein